MSVDRSIPESSNAAAGPQFTFGRGSMVLVSLSAPREKFWGAILELTPAGVSLRGIDLNCFDDYARQVRSGDQVTPNAVFFPMHRVERMVLDAASGDIPSLSQRFCDKSGVGFAHLLRLEATSETSPASGPERTTQGERR